VRINVNVEFLFELQIKVEFADGVLFDDFVRVSLVNVFSVVKNPKSFRMTNDVTAASAVVRLEGEHFEIAGKTLRKVDGVALFLKHLVNSRNSL
jgi:hypothetical protein